jgi:hypothetical protein
LNPKLKVDVSDSEHLLSNVESERQRWTACGQPSTGMDLYAGMNAVSQLRVFCVRPEVSPDGRKPYTYEDEDE